MRHILGPARLARGDIESATRALSRGALLDLSAEADTLELSGGAGPARSRSCAVPGSSQ